MKNVIVSVCAVALLIGGWLVFAHYSQEKIDGFNQFIKDDIITAVEASDWQNSNKKMKKLNKDWHKYKKVAIFFLDTQTINEIDYSMAKSVKYVKAEDVSNSSGELNAMGEQLAFLCTNDEVNWGNIF